MCLKKNSKAFAQTGKTGNNLMSTEVQMRILFFCDSNKIMLTSHETVILNLITNTATKVGHIRLDGFNSIRHGS